MTKLPRSVNEIQRDQDEDMRRFDKVFERMTKLVRADLRKKCNELCEARR